MSNGDQSADSRDYSDRRTSRSDLMSDPQIAAQNQAPPGYAEPQDPGSRYRTTVKTHSGRTVFGLMFFATSFALLGQQIKAAKSGGVLEVPTKLGADTKIILGGTVATVLLMMLTHAGDVGSELATGLAGLCLLGSVLYAGSPVWSTLSTALGSKPTTPLSGATKPAAPTTKTGVTA